MKFWHKLKSSTNHNDYSKQPNAPSRIAIEGMEEITSEMLSAEGVIQSEIEANNMQNTLTIEYTDDLLFTLGVSDKEFSEEAKLLLAAKLYEMGRISSGQAARLAGKSRVEFLFSLSRLGVPVSNLKAEDIETESSFALND